MSSRFKSCEYKQPEIEIPPQVEYVAEIHSKCVVVVVVVVVVGGGGGGAGCGGIVVVNG